jgi:hypothetical protein
VKSEAEILKVNRDLKVLKAKEVIEEIRDL